MSKTKIKCENKLCGKEFLKENKEINRSRKLGRKQYCSMFCYSQDGGKDHLNFVSLENQIKNKKRIKNYCGNRRDELTPFRFFTHVIRNSRKNKSFNIDDKYLKEIWDYQKGICPLTGWKLVLPDSTSGWNTSRNGKRASLDRIDNSEGYIVGNVRFISYMANMALNNMSDYDLIQFCVAVVNNRGNKK